MTAPSARSYCPPELYDVIYADMRLDLEHHLAEARAARGPVLEACCGNGRLMIPTLEAGVDCDGFDLDEAMLRDLKRKLAERDLKAGAYHADMRDFTLPRRYALIVIPFSSFLHNLTQAEQLATLRCCREHLEEGGQVSIVAFQPSLKRLLEFDGTPVLVKQIPNIAAPGTARVFDAVTCDRVEQTCSVTRRLELLDPSGTLTAAHEFEFSFRYIWKPEMELLLRGAGFKRWVVRRLPKGPDEAAGHEANPRPEEGDILAWSAWKD